MNKLEIYKYDDKLSNTQYYNDIIIIFNNKYGDCWYVYEIDKISKNIISYYIVEKYKNIFGTNSPSKKYYKAIDYNSILQSKLINKFNTVFDLMDDSSTGDMPEVYDLILVLWSITCNAKTLNKNDINILNKAYHVLNSWQF